MSLKIKEVISVLKEDASAEYVQKYPQLFMMDEDLNGVVGARETSYPTSVEVIKEKDEDGNNSYRLLVNFANKPSELVPSQSDDKRYTLDELLSSVQEDEFYEEFYLPAIMKVIEIEQ